MRGVIACLRFVLCLTCATTLQIYPAPFMKPEVLSFLRRMGMAIWWSCPMRSTWSRFTRRSSVSSGTQKCGRTMYLSSSSPGGNTSTKALRSVVEDRVQRMIQRLSLTAVGVVPVEVQRHLRDRFRQYADTSVYSRQLHRRPLIYHLSGISTAEKERIR